MVMLPQGMVGVGTQMWVCGVPTFLKVQVMFSWFETEILALVPPVRVPPDGSVQETVTA